MIRTLLFFALLMSSSMVIGQEISEGAIQMAYGVQNSVAIQIPFGDLKKVDALYKDYMKERYGKVKKVKKSDEFVLENVRIPDVNGIDAFNLYSRVQSIGSDAQLVLWCELATDEYLSQENHPEKYEGIVTLLRDFEFYVRMDQATLAVEEQEKTLKNLEKDLDKLTKDKEKLLSEIEKAKQAIIKAEQEIVDNEVNQEQTKLQIESQMETVEKVRAEKEELRKAGPSKG